MIDQLLDGGLFSQELVSNLPYLTLYPDGVANSQKGRRGESTAREEWWSCFLQNLKVFFNSCFIFQKY
jgi:hypothetical protein